MAATAMTRRSSDFTPSSGAVRMPPFTLSTADVRKPLSQRRSVRANHISSANESRPFLPGDPLEHCVRGLIALRLASMHGDEGSAMHGVADRAWGSTLGAL